MSAPMNAGPDGTILPATAPPARRPHPARLVRVCANLLPDEIIAGRRLRRMQRRIAVGLATLLVLLGLGYGYTRWQTGQAKGDLATAQAHGETLAAQQRSFTDLTQTQQRTAALQTQLSAVMGNDTSWRDLLDSLNHAAAGVARVGSVSGQLADPTAATNAAPTTSSLESTGKPIIGRLTVSGVSPDYAKVATFVNRLAAIKGFSVVDPASLTAGTDGTLGYTVNISLTTDVLGGRFAVHDTGLGSGVATTRTSVGK